MKRFLFGTSALGLTLAVLGSAPVMATSVTQPCTDPSTINDFVCDDTSTDSGTFSSAKELNISSSSGNATVVFTKEEIQYLDLIGATGTANTKITFGAQTTSAAAGRLKFSDITLGDSDDTVIVEGSNSLTTTSGTTQGDAGALTNSNLDFGAGDDKLYVGGIISNNGSTTGPKNVDMGLGDDRIDIIAGGQMTLSSPLTTGDGKDKFYNDGYLSGVVEMGDGEDYFQNSNTFDGRIDMGDGNDEFHAIDYIPTLPNVTTLDGGAHDMIQDPNDPTAMIPTAGDILRLDGTSGSSNLNAEQIANFEGLIKQGVGTWSMGSATAAASTVAFVNGVQVNEGTMNFNDMTLVSTVTNSGTITGDFKIDSLQNTTANDTPSLFNTNLGTIAGNITFSDFDDHFVNEGIIRESHSDNVTPVNLNMGGGSDSFENSGNVSGIVNLGDDDDRFILNGSGLFQISPAGTILGGAHSATGGDTIELAGAGGTLVQINDGASRIKEFENLDITNGTWALAANQTFDGDVNVLGGTFNSSTQVTARNLNVNGGTMNQSGAFTATNTSVTNGTLNILNSLLSSPVSVGNNGFLNVTGSVNGNLTVGQGGSVSAIDHTGIGDFDVAGNMIVEDGGNVVVNVDPVTGLADIINVDGFLTINDGATIEVIPTSALAQGQYFEVTVADAALVNGVFSVSANFAYTDYQIEYGDDGTVNLLMGAAFAPVSVTPGLNANPNANLDVNGNQIAAHLAAANTTPALGAPYDDVVRTIVLGNTSQAQAAVDAVSSEFYNSAYLSARSYANHVGSKIVDRIDDKEWCGTMQSAGESNCRTHRGDSGDLWGSLEVYSSSNKSSSVSSYKSTAFAGLIGMDRRIGIMTAGVVGGFGVSSSDVNTKGTSKGFNASVGGYFSVPARVLNVDTSLVYNYGSGDSARSFNNAVVTANASGGTVTNGTTSFTGKSTTHQVSSDVRLTQEYKNEMGIEIQPSIGFGLDYVKMPGFTESATGGLSGLALVMEDSSHFSADAKLGVQARMPIRTTAGTIIPEGRVNVAKKIVGEKMTTQARFVETQGQNAADFQIESDLPDLTFNVGVGVNYELDSGLVFMGDYDFNGGSDTSEHKGSLGMRYDF